MKEMIRAQLEIVVAEVELARLGLGISQERHFRAAIAALKTVLEMLRTAPSSPRGH